MFLHIIRGYRRTYGIALCGLLFLILTITFLVLFLSLSSQLEMTEILNEDSYLTVVVPNFDTADDFDARRSFQNGGYSQISSVKQVYKHTLAYAYSPVLSPSYIPEHDGTNCVANAAIMPTSYFVGTVICEKIEMTQDKLFGTPRYNYRVSCKMDERICVFSEHELLDQVTVILRVLANETVPMEIGKTYLVWGLLSVDENGEAELYTMHQSDAKTALVVLQDNGVHWRMETSARNGLIIPWISEMNGALDTFWETENGKQWQTDIISRGDILHHSVKLIGIDLTQGLLSFNRGTSYITAGCSPEESELPNGCLISEELAARSGLSLGDEFKISVYTGVYRSYNRNTDTFSCNYEDMYTPYGGYTEQQNLRIVGLYRTEDDIHSLHAIHPDTIFVKNSLLHGNYAPAILGSTILNDSATVVDAKYSLVIPTGAEELFFSEAQMYGIGRKYFLIGDSGYAANEAELGELDRAMESAREQYTAIVPVCCWISLGTVVLILFALTWSANGEINHLYGIDTANRTLFLYLYRRQGTVLLLGFVVSVGLLSVLYRPMAQWWLSRFVSRSLAEQVIAYLPSTSPGWGIWLSVFAICAILAVPLSWLGTGRKYHYAYHDTRGSK
ncbi:MAG: hypothetical protein J6S14_01600 [Clostridia bacterium]|nr:hypothetical protein [Clostridia bacterium]